MVSLSAACCACKAPPASCQSSRSLRVTMRIERSKRLPQAPTTTSPNLQVRARQREWALLGSNRELRFLADLGRGLLRTLEPDQLVRRVAGAVYDGTGATLSAAFVSLNDDAHAGCVFDRE